MMNENTPPIKFIPEVKPPMRFVFDKLGQQIKNDHAVLLACENGHVDQYDFLEIGKCRTCCNGTKFQKTVREIAEELFGKQFVFRKGPPVSFVAPSIRIVCAGSSPTKYTEHKIYYVAPTTSLRKIRRALGAGRPNQKQLPYSEALRAELFRN